MNVSEYTPDFFEKSIIKLILTNQKIRDRILPYLDIKIFHTIQNRNIISTIMDLDERYPSAFPSVSNIKLEISDNETLEAFNSALNLKISDFQEEHFLTKIEEYFKQSKIFNLLTDAVTDMQDNKFDELAEVTNKLRETISFSFNCDIGLNLFNADSFDKVYDFFHNTDSYVPSGLTAFDKAVSGGFHEKSLSLFLAATNVGKSLVMTALASNAVLQGKKILYITLEMNEFKIAERILANLFDVAVNDLKYISKTGFKLKFDSIISTFANSVIIKEFPAKTISANNILSVVKEAEVKQNFIADEIFIDYIGLMNPIRMKRDEADHLEKQRVSEEVRAVSQEIGTPIISALQTNRSGVGNAFVDLKSIASSFGTAMTADIITAVTQTEEQRTAGIFTWYILKNRYGLNNLRIPSIGVDIPKMKLFDISTEAEDMSLENTEGEVVEETTTEDMQTFLKNRKQSGPFGGRI